MRVLRCVLAVLCISLLASLEAAAARTEHEELPLPLLHGNWCGLGDRDRARPVDALDRACRTHDLCYERAGRNACSCDRTFLKATARLVDDRRLDDGARQAAAVAHSYFSIAPCVEHPVRR